MPEAKVEPTSEAKTVAEFNFKAGPQPVAKAAPDVKVPPQPQEKVEPAARSQGRASA